MAESGGIVFGELNCFIRGESKTSTRQVYSKQDDIHLELKRYVVIHQQNGTHNFDIEFYKDESKFKKRKPLFREELNPKKCCGITRGNVEDRPAKRKKSVTSDKSTMYLALIFVDFTVILMLSGDADEAKSRICEWETACNRLMRHVKTKRVVLDSAPTEDENQVLRPGTLVLLSLTCDRISVSSYGNYHRCCHSWAIQDVCLLNDDLKNGSDCLAIKVHRHGAYTFKRASSSSILADIRSEVMRSVQDRIDEMLPYHVSHSKKDVETFKRPSCVRWVEGHAIQKVPRPAEPLPDLVQLSEEVRSSPKFFLEDDTSTVSYGEYMTTCIQELSVIYENYVRLDARSENGDFDCDLNEMAIKYRNDMSDMYLTTDYDASTKKSHAGSSTLPLRRISQPSLSLDPHPRVLLQRRVSCQEIKLKGPTSLPILEAKLASHVEENPTKMVGSHGQDSELRRSRQKFQGGSENLIFRTIERVLQGIPPHKDTLGLSHKQRVMLCIHLYLPCPETAGTSEGSWVLLAENIGLRMEAIELISRIVSNHRLTIPAAEIVLRHWQHMFNKYGPTGPDGKCPYACSRENLLFILGDKMKRCDLVDIIQQGCER